VESKQIDQELLADNIVKNAQKVCFWSNDDGDIFTKENPDPETVNSIVADWNKTEEAHACIFYMEKSKIPDPQVYFIYRGYAHCRICECGLGDADLLTPDAKYIFPELWWHYIEKHSVKPKNDTFINDAVDYYNAHKNDPQETKNCHVCNEVFKIDHRNHSVCSNDCGIIDNYLKSNYYSSCDLNEIENIAIKKNLTDIIIKIREHKLCLTNCSYCGKNIKKEHSTDANICKSYNCQFLNNILTNNTTKLSIQEIMELNENNNITNYLLEKFHNIKLSKIQRIYKGKEIQYIIIN